MFSRRYNDDPSRTTECCDFIGVPEGRNHYYDLYKDAQARGLESRKKISKVSLLQSKVL